MLVPPINIRPFLFVDKERGVELFSISIFVHDTPSYETIPPIIPKYIIPC